MATSFTEFGTAAQQTAIAHKDLPRDFQYAMIRSSQGVPTAQDDLNVGSVRMGSGYCADPKYRQQLYCACVNAPVTFPECVFSPCANASGITGAYKPIAAQAVLQNASARCPKIINCTQILQMGGSQNVASGVGQAMNCGEDSGGPTPEPPIAADNGTSTLLLIIIALLVGIIVAALGYLGREYLGQAIAGIAAVFSSPDGDGSDTDSDTDGDSSDTKTGANSDTDE